MQSVMAFRYSFCLSRRAPFPCNVFRKPSFVLPISTPSIVRHAAVKAAVSDTASQSRERSLTFRGAQHQLEAMKGDVWEENGRADDFLRHVVYSPLLSDKNERVELVEDFLRRAEAESLEMNVARYNMVLQVFVRNEHDFDPELFSKKMEIKGIKPDVITCNLLLMAYSQQGKLSGALSVLQVMRKAHFKLGEQVYASLITAYSRVGELAKSLKILSLMEANGIVPTALSFKALLFACAESGDEDKLIETIENVQKARVFIDYFSVRDLLCQLGSRDMLGAMASMLKEMHNLAFMRTYLQEALAQLIKTQRLDASLLIYEHLLRLPPDVQSSSTSEPAEHYADMAFFQAVAATTEDVDKQRDMLLAAVQVAPSRSHLLTMLLRQQLDDRRSSSEALRTFKFMSWNDVPVYPHWLQELVALAAKQGDVRQAVKIYSTLANMNLQITPAMSSLLLRAMAQSRVPVKRFIGYLGCVRLYPELVNQLLSAYADLDVPSDRAFQDGLLEVVTSQQSLKADFWKDRQIHQRYLREPVDVAKVCKHVVHLSEERPLPDSITFLESTLSSCDLPSGVEIIQWAVKGGKRILLGLKKELYEDLLQLLHDTEMSTGFLDLSRAMRDLGIPPPASWKGMAVSMHLHAGNLEAASIVYDLLLSSQEDVSRHQEIHRRIFQVMFDHGKHEDVIKSYERLVQFLKKSNLSAKILAITSRSYIHLHQLDAAKNVLLSSRIAPEPGITASLAAGFYAEKRFEACIGVRDLIMVGSGSNTDAYTDTFLTVLRAYVELGAIHNFREFYSYLSRIGVRAPAYAPLQVAVYCNAGDPILAYKCVSSVNDGPTLWKLFSSLLGHKSPQAPKFAADVLGRLAAMKSYGPLPSFFGLLLAGNLSDASRCLQTQSFSLPLAEVMDVFLKPLVVQCQWPTIHDFLRVVKAHPSVMPLFFGQVIDLLADQNEISAMLELQDLFPDVPLTVKAKAFLRNGTLTEAAGEDVQPAREGLSLDTLDRSVIGLLVDAQD